MAINPNTARNAMHASVVCMTGAGKGVAMNSLGLIPREHPVIIFDPHGEYRNFAGRKVYRYKTRINLAKALPRAWASKKPFVIAYTPDAEGEERKKVLRKEAYWLASLVWAISDGNRILVSLWEELGEYVEGNAADDSPIGLLWTGGRKFGIWATAVFQRSAEVPKTIWTNSPRKVIGAQGGINDKKRVMAEIGCEAEDVDDLGSRNIALSMYSSVVGETVRTKVHYLFSESAGRFSRVSAYVKPAESLRKAWSADQKRLAGDKKYKLGI